MKHLILATLLLTTASLSAQSPNITLDAFLRDSLDAHVQRGMKRWGMPAVAVAVIRGSDVLVSKGYGSTELNGGQPVNENTLFQIGSNTKAFTGTLMAMLVDEKKCELTDPVQKYLPKFQMQDRWVASHLTLADAVSHRMGMETFQGDFTYWTSNLSTDEVLEHFGRFTPVYGFREKWGYTNAGFALAGECARTMTGKSWADNIRERIFKPLEMKNSLALSTEMAKAANTAQPYSSVEGKIVRLPWANIDNLGAAGSIGSSVQDMSHWMMAQLDQGAYKGKLSEAARMLPREPLSILGRDGRPGHHYTLYGMGWILEDYYGKEIVSHTGGVNGYVTAVTLIPELNIGIVVLTNTDANSYYQSLESTLRDVAVGAPFKDWDSRSFNNHNRSEARTAATIKLWRDSVAQNNKPTQALGAYEGRYNNGQYGYVDIKKKGTELEMSFQHHSMTARLQAMGGQRFLVTYSDPMMGIRVFEFEGKGDKAKSFVLSAADFVEFTTYKFER